MAFWDQNSERRTLDKKKRQFLGRGDLPQLVPTRGNLDKIL